jgi:hypothetical protein
MGSGEATFAPIYIFGYILQYLHSGGYSVLILAADKSSHVTYEDEIDIVT